MAKPAKPLPPELEEADYKLPRSLMAFAAIFNLVFLFLVGTGVLKQRDPNAPKEPEPKSSYAYGFVINNSHELLEKLESSTFTGRFYTSCSYKEDEGHTWEVGMSVNLIEKTNSKLSFYQALGVIRESANKVIFAENPTSCTLAAEGIHNGRAFRIDAELGLKNYIPKDLEPIAEAPVQAPETPEAAKIDANKIAQTSNPASTAITKTTKTAKNLSHAPLNQQIKKQRTNY